MNSENPEETQVIVGLYKQIEQHDSTQLNFCTVLDEEIEYNKQINN